jgi:hypothetical protein
MYKNANAGGAGAPGGQPGGGAGPSQPADDRAASNSDVIDAEVVEEEKK